MPAAAPVADAAARRERESASAAAGARRGAAAVPGLPMSPGAGIGVGAEGAPPFALPGEHFAAGMVWLLLGSAGLVAVAPLLALGGFTAPRVVAVVHCFTLGWLTTSIFGALYQLFPVALGVPARSVRRGHVTFWLLQAGVLALVAGFWWWSPPLLGLGWVLLVGAVWGLASNLLPQRRRAPRGRLMGWYVAGAHLGIGLAMLVAAARIGNLLGWWEVDALRLLATHVHLAALGFGTLTVVGVGSRLLPMFLLSHGHAEWPLRWIGPLVGAGLVAFGVGELAGVPAAAAAGALLMAAGVALYLYQAWEYFRRRVRRVLDPGLALAAVAHGFLGLALVLGLALALRGVAEPRLVGAYGVAAILGWLALLVAGIYHKILPFLTWLHRFGTRVGEEGLPRVAELTVRSWGWASVALLGGGTLLLAASVALGLPHAARAAAVLVATGAAVMGAQGVRLVSLR